MGTLNLFRLRGLVQERTTRAGVQATVTIYPRGSINESTGALIGTPTAVLIYTDQDGDSAKANPFDTNAYGEWNCYIGPGSYDILYTSALIATQWECDAQVPWAVDGDGNVEAAGALRYSHRTQRTFNVKDFGAVGNGSTDNTAAFDAAIAAVAAHGGGTLVVPYSALAYRLDPIQLCSNLDLVLEPGVLLKANGGMGTGPTPHGVGEYEGVLIMTSVDNVRIFANGATIQLIKADYIAGQNRRGLPIRGCNNVEIYGLTVKDTGGDGISVSQADAGQAYCQNVRLINCTVDGALRSGIAIFSGVNIMVEGCECKNTLDTITGTLPQTGIHIEPYASSQVLRNIVIRNCRTIDNVGYGIGIGLEVLTAGVTASPVQILVDGHYSHGDFWGAIVTKIDVTTHPLQGEIEFRSCVWDTPDLGGIRIVDKDVNGPIVKVINCVTVDPNESEDAQYVTAGIVVDGQVARTGSASIGGVLIDSPVIVDTRSSPHLTALNHYIFVQDRKTSSPSMKNVVIRDPTLLGATPIYKMRYHSSGQVVDSFDMLEQDLGDVNWTNVPDDLFASVYQNANFTSTHTVTLEKVQVGFPDIRFEVRAASALGIVPEATDAIAGWGAVGKYIFSNEVGAYVVLRKVTADTWAVVGMSGTWERQLTVLNNADQVLAAVNYDRLCTNSAYTAGHALTLPASISGSGDIEVVIEAAQICTITCAGSDKIYPGTVSTWAAGAIGARLRLRPMGSNIWHIVHQVGTWA